MIIWRGFDVHKPTSCNTATAKAQLLIDVAVNENPDNEYGSYFDILKFILEGERISYQQIHIFQNTSIHTMLSSTVSFISNWYYFK